VAEAFRTLRSAVVFAGVTPTPKVVVVTSAVAGEGKTVTSLNLAAALAEAGGRVVLVDGDLRRPGCHRLLGVDDEAPGLSAVLAGEAALEHAVRTLAELRLAFLPAGRTPSNPAALIGAPRLREVLGVLAAGYDFVVVDSPPVLPVTDALVLGREADAVVLVVKGHETPREMVRRARDQLRQANAHVLGATVNDVDLGWSDLYAYGRYYTPLEEVA
jgi:capsular exopolysaccharide synthesis family protein